MTITATEILESINPATGEVVGSVPITPTAAIAGIVEKARTAQKSWNELGLDKRIEILRPAAKRLAEEAPEIGKLMTSEMGKSTPLASSEWGKINS